MVGYRVSLIALLLLSALISPMSFAKSVRLKTITVNQTTPYGTLYGQIHFDEKDLDVALKVEKIIKNDLIKVVNYFQHVPKNTVHFNVDPYIRLTNGNARVFPTNIINIYKFPASNSEHLIVFDDWLRGLVFHEYTHITHLDQTRGFVEGGRKIFGNVAKLLTNDVPRWFTEGIAVWSESHLMNGDGRLQNPLFRKELLVQFLNNDFCKTIDCLDDPGVYPNGQLAYWAGAHFIEYLENKKPGAVKCLVESNSQNFPFFLDSVFTECTGNSAQNNFDNFRSELISSQPKAASESEGTAVVNAFGSNNLQKGVILDENILYKVEQDREREALVSYDLQENVSLLVSKFHYGISELQGITTMPALDPEAKYLLMSFHEDPFFRGNNRTWKLINAETLLAEAELPFKNDPSYVIGLGNNRFLTASFIDNNWRIERQRIDLVNKTAAEVVLVQQFSSGISLTYFKKSGQTVFMKIHLENESTSLVMSDLTMEKFYSVYSSKNYYDIPVLNEKFIVVREKENSAIYEFNGEFKTFSKSTLGIGQLNGVASLETNDGRILMLENNLKSKDMSLKDTLASLKKGSSASASNTFTAVSFNQAQVVAETPDMESFPKFYHLRPYYWFIATGTSDNLFSIGAMTTFSDPMDINIINASVLTYPSESKIGGSLNFVHKFTSVSDLWSVNGFFNQEYSKTDFSPIVNETTEGSIGTNYTILLQRWALIPGLYAGTTKTNDFISGRTTNHLGSNLVAQYQAQHFDDFFQNLIFQVKLQNDLPDTGKNFFNLQSKIQIEARFQERLTAGIKSSYGKLYKSGFSQGVLYGGGATGLGTNRWHEFYGVPYSNAYGNEIMTLRLYLDYNFWYIYHGNGLTPIYFREAHLLLGRDMMSADRIILNDRVIRDKTIHSLFIGPRLKMNVLYYIPLDLDLIFSSIKNPNGGTVNQVELGMNADLF
ncbi:MAG: hypothetical protein H7336_06940 [Bacteriovorax sp.]|nr:hypothetical protein [Bacteriovorax sp.]